MALNLGKNLIIFLIPLARAWSNNENVTFIFNYKKIRGNLGNYIHRCEGAVEERRNSKRRRGPRPTQRKEI